LRVGGGIVVRQEPLENPNQLAIEQILSGKIRLISLQASNNEAGGFLGNSTCGLLRHFIAALQATNCFSKCL
jgi:hypothetical protein